MEHFLSHPSSVSSNMKSSARTNAPTHQHLVFSMLKGGGQKTTEWILHFIYIKCNLLSPYRLTHTIFLMLVRWCVDVLGRQKFFKKVEKKSINICLSQKKVVILYRNQRKAYTSPEAPPDRAENTRKRTRRQRRKLPTAKDKRDGGKAMDCRRQT